jgi:hypothetical protein
MGQGRQDVSTHGASSGILYPEQETGGAAQRKVTGGVVVQTARCTPSQ